LTKDTVNFNQVIDSTSNFFKKVLDKKTMMKFKYMPTSINRSSKNLKTKIWKDNKIELSARPRMIHDYKVPPPFETVSTFLPHTATTIYSVLKKKQKEL
jgi:hypothetical protein